MANRPSAMHRRRPNMTGCMGSIAHLFDFNQTLAVRKLLTNSKTYGSEGMDISNKYSNGGIMDERVKNISKGEHHNGDNSSRRLHEAPIKALIADELAKEPCSSKSRAPGIVARLMGIDALPGNIKSKPKLKKKAKRPQKLPFNELPNTKSGSYHSAKNVKNDTSSHAGNFSEIFSADALNKEGHTLGLDPERDRNEHGELVDTPPMIWKPENPAEMRALDNLDGHLVGKQMLTHSKLIEDNSFVKILERIDSSLVARDLHTSNGDNLVSENVGGFTGKFSKENVKSQSFDCKIDEERSPGFFSELFSTENQFKHFFWNVNHTHHSTEYAVAEPVTEKQQQTPTRIVVLKPGPSKVRNVKFSSQDCPRSPKGLLKEMEIIKENSVHVLHDLRKRLLQLDDELSEFSKLPRYQQNLPEVPQEIAQEIVMRARESVTKELIDNRANLGTTLHNNGSGCIPSGREHRNKSSRSQNLSIDVKSAGKDTASEQSNIWVRSLESAFTKLSYHEDLPNNSDRHTVNETNLSQRSTNVPHIADIDLDSSSPSHCDSGAESDMYTRFLTRSFSLHEEEEEGISGKSGLRSKSTFPHHKCKNKLAEDDAAIWESRRNKIPDTEKNQCQIDDIGPVLDSDSASSIENFPSLESATSLKHLSQVELSSTESATMCGNVTLTAAQVNQSTDNLEDSEDATGSPSNIPRGTMKLSKAGTMVANLKLNKDPCEQPSPVSVLDAPFHEESSNSMHFSDIRSRLHELRSCLQLSKYIDDETSSNPGTCQDDESIDEEMSIENSFEIDMTGRDQMGNVGMLMHGIPCPPGRELELIYVRDLLVASGFVDDNATTLVKWHEPNLPRAYNNFERMVNDHNSNSRLSRKEKTLPGCTQHILYDIVDEVLFEMLQSESSTQQWWKPQFGSTMVIPSGKLLLQTVWEGVCEVYNASVDGQDTLGNLVAKDLSRRDGWQNSDLQFAALVLDLEQAIFDELMLETINF